MAIDGLTAEQEGNARAVIGAVTTSAYIGADNYSKAAIIAIATCIVESNLINVNYGDRDSLGLFQQRASWGTEAQRMDPVYAAHSFYQRLAGLGAWYNLPPGDAAQEVQVSAFPDRYAEQIDKATGIVNAVMTDTPPPADPDPQPEPAPTPSNSANFTIREAGNLLLVDFPNGKVGKAYPSHVRTWLGNVSVPGEPDPDPDPNPDPDPDPTPDPDPDPGTGDGSFSDPFPGHYDANDPFGNYGGRQYPHTGSDWNGLPAGTPIGAIADGKVARVEWSDGNGNTITVKFPPNAPGGGEFYWAFLHMEEEANVRVGWDIAKGRIIGKLGNTGSNSVGAHLHITMSDSDGANLGLGRKFDPYVFITTGVKRYL